MSAQAALEALQRVGLEPVLEAAREKVYRQNGVRGQIAVLLSPQAREELANLTGRTYGKTGAVDISLAHLDAGLRKSRFGVDLLAVLAARYGPLLTRQQAQAQEAARWGTWLERVGRSLALPHEPAHALATWFNGIITGDSPSGRWVRRTYGSDPDAAATAVAAVGRALAALPSAHGGHELLAVFAAGVTGDPHGFDAGTPAGSLLLQALTERVHPFDEALSSPDERLRLSERRALLLDLAGLGVDQVSSTVLVAHLQSASTVAGQHPVVAAMAAYGGAWSVTLGEVRRWTTLQAVANRAYVMENPPVFEYLLQRLASKNARRPTLICTGGFLSAAAVRLLDLLAQGGAELWYGGDFDRNGLAIATWLAERYGVRWRPWRMAPEDYARASAGAARALAPEERQALERFTGPLAETAHAVAQGGAAYQERLVDMLLSDLTG